jgi:predicted KAP-like P-loop ATPase
LADVPVRDSKQDQLGRSTFVKALARTIKSMKGEDSFVFGLCGPWGSGKSSVLRLVTAELQRDRASNNPLVIDFNPWWFAGHDQLLEAFLGQLGSALGRIDTGGRVSALGSKLSNLGKLLRPFGVIPGASVVKNAGEALEAAGGATTSLGERLSGDVNQVRREIDELLRKNEQRLVVVMDDIDRLTAQEMAQLFLIVKAVADFPYTIYLLAFDQGVVTKALSDILHVDGVSYLEKIVQIQIDIPPSSPIQLQSLFLSHLDGLLQSDAVTDKAKNDFANFFHDGLKNFLRTPRHVKRMSNVLRVLYPAVEGEVYWPDFIAIIGLMLFVPTAYRALRDHRERFTGSGDSREFQREDEKRFHEEWLNQIPEDVREISRAIVCRLFPRASLALERGGFSHEFESQWRADLRACSAGCFDRYFQLRVPEGEFSEAEWKEVVAIIDDDSALDARIQAFSRESGPHHGGSRVKEFLERVSIFCTHHATIAQARRVFEALLRNGDEILAVPDLDQAHLVPISNDLRLSWAMRDAIERIPEIAEREAEILAAFNRKFGLRAGAQFAWFAGAQHGRYDAQPNAPHEPRLVSEAFAAQLVPILVERLTSAAQNGDLAAHPKWLVLLYDWRRFGGADEAQKWLEAFAADDRNFLRLLDQAKNIVRVHNIRDHVATEVPTIDAKGLVSWFDGKDLRRRATAILASNPAWLTDSDRHGLQLMLQMIDDDGRARDPVPVRRIGPNEERNADGAGNDSEASSGNGDTTS